MDTIFINSTNAKTSNSNKLSLRLVNKIDLSYTKESVVLANLSIHYSWKNITASLKNNIIIIGTVGPDGGKVDYPITMEDGSYSIKDMQSYISFELRKQNLFPKGKRPENIIIIYPNEIRNRIVFFVEKGFYLKLPSKELRELHGSTEKIIDKSKTRELVPKIEPVTAVLVHCSLSDNEYQKDSNLLYTFVPNKPFGSFLDIEPRSTIFVNVYGTLLYNIDVWFTDQDNNPLDIEDSKI